MKSPFPGMDPYLEKYWRDVHHSLCTYARDFLQPQLGGSLRARLEERLVVESDIGEDRSIYPDVKIVQRHGAGYGDVEVQSGVAVEEPLLLRVEDEAATEAFVTIIDTTTGGKLVTVIEFLSTTNKLPGEGRKQYRQKQLELKEAGVSLVEIDLLRSGQWVMQVAEYRVPSLYRTTYQVCAHRGWKHAEYEIYRAPLRRRLPTINIPLRESDPDAKLDLQSLIEQAYRNGAYDDIDYSVPPEPPLSPEDAAWAAELRTATR
jgi:hypothetical protein